MSGHADTIRAAFEGTLEDPRGEVAAALDALLAENREWQELSARQLEQFTLTTQEYRAENQRLRDALEAYADARHWAISRDDLNHKVVSWIGPGAETNGQPNPMQVAREALAGDTE